MPPNPEDTTSAYPLQRWLLPSFRNLVYRLEKCRQTDTGLCEVCTSCLKGEAKQIEDGRFVHHTSFVSFARAARSGCVLCASMWNSITPHQQRVLTRAKQFRHESGLGVTNLSLGTLVDSSSYKCWTPGIYSVQVDKRSYTTVDEVWFDELDIGHASGGGFLIPSSGQPTSTFTSLRSDY